MIIPLTKGFSTVIDDEDADLADLAWHVSAKGYAVRRDAKMHRLVLSRMVGRNLLATEQADHINGDRLDNRRSNLRVATRAENARNVRRPNFSGFHGVSWDRTQFKWLAQISIAGQKIKVGRFKDLTYAAAMRDQWAIDLHGDFAVLNFDYVEVERQDG